MGFERTGFEHSETSPGHRGSIQILHEPGEASGNPWGPAWSTFRPRVLCPFPVFVCFSANALIQRLIHALQKGSVGLVFVCASIVSHREMTSSLSFPSKKHKHFSVRSSWISKNSTTTTIYLTDSHNIYASLFASYEDRS